MRKIRRLIVLGIMGRDPCAGIAWEVLHYLEGFRRLGHDVYYIEDDREWPYDPVTKRVTKDCTYAVRFIRKMLRWCGFPQDHWAYRAAARDGQIYGMSKGQFTRVFETADALINITGSTALYGEHLKVPVRVYVQTDPGCAEIEIAKGCRETIELVKPHTHFLTFAENQGAADCGLPKPMFSYRATRQPIVMDWFVPNPEAAPNGNPRQCLRFTTVGNWEQDWGTDWNGEFYAWSKHLEFLKFIDLPERLGYTVELALSSINAAARRLLSSHRWKVLNAVPMTRDILPYRDYILGSDGEFTVAKDVNIRLRTGWFSERSASYLTAAKPVITQDTGFGNILPTGRGLFSFRTMDDVLGAFDAIQSDYKRHSCAARAIAEEYFRAEKVLGNALKDVGL